VSSLADKHHVLQTGIGLKDRVVRRLCLKQTAWWLFFYGGVLFDSPGWHGRLMIFSWLIWVPVDVLWN